MKASNKIINFLLIMLVAIVGGLVVGHTVGIFPDYFAGISTAGGVGVATIALINLDHDSDSCNMAGITSTAYLIRIEDIETMASITETPLTVADKIKLVGNIVPKTGKYFTKLYCTDQLGELNSDVDGPRDGEIFKIGLTLFYPSTDADALGMAALMKNADLLCIVEEFSGSGQWRVIGHPKIPLRLKPSEKTGKGRTDQKGIEMKGEWMWCTPAPVYEGTIPLSVSEVIS